MPKHVAIAILAILGLGCSTSETTEEPTNDSSPSESGSDGTSLDSTSSDSTSSDSPADASIDTTPPPFDADFSDTAAFPDVPVSDTPPADSGGTKCAACEGGCYFVSLKFCQEGSGSSKASCDLATPKGIWYPGTCPGACPKTGQTGGCRRVSPAPASCTVIFWHYDATTLSADKASCTSTCPTGHTCTWIAP